MPPSPPPALTPPPSPCHAFFACFSSLGSRLSMCVCRPPPSAAPRPSPSPCPPGSLHGAFMSMREHAQRCYSLPATTSSRFAPPPMPPSPAAPALRQRCRTRRIALTSRHAIPSAWLGFVARVDLGSRVPPVLSARKISSAPHCRARVSEVSLTALALTPCVLNAMRLRSASRPAAKQWALLHSWNIRPVGRRATKVWKSCGP